MMHARRPLPRLYSALFVFLCFAGAGAAETQEASLPAGSPASTEPATISPSILLLLPAIEQGRDAAPFAEALRQALGSELAASGFEVSEGLEALAGQNEPQEAARLAAAAGAGWVAVTAVATAADRMVYRAAVYDAGDGSLVAADAFSVYAGLSALSLIADSARNIAARAAAYRDASRRGSSRPIVYRIAVTSPDEGASVYLGGTGSKAAIPAGRIRDGKLLLPYFSIPEGTRIGIGVEAPGKLPARVEAMAGREPLVVELPALAAIPRRSLLAGTGTGRLLGAGLAYRDFFSREWSFFFLEDDVFALSDFRPGSAPLIRNDLWMGFGWYLYFPPESRFRAGFAAGLGLLSSLATGDMGSSRLFVDLALIPAELFAEWRLDGKSGIWISLRSSFSFGVSGGLYPYGWMMDGFPSLAGGFQWRL